MHLRAPLPLLVLATLAACAGDKGESPDPGDDPADTGAGTDTDSDSDADTDSDPGDSGEPASRSHFMAGTYEHGWDCLAWYEVSATPLAAEEICDDCELGFEIDAALDPTYPEAHGLRSCEDGALDDTWASDEAFTTRWSFELDDALHQMAWYEYAGAWYPTAELSVGAAEDGTPYLLWGFNEDAHDELSLPSEVWTFKIYSY